MVPLGPPTLRKHEPLPVTEKEDEDEYDCVVENSVAAGNEDDADGDADGEPALAESVTYNVVRDDEEEEARPEEKNVGVNGYSIADETIEDADGFFQDEGEEEDVEDHHYSEDEVGANGYSMTLSAVEEDKNRTKQKKKRKKRRKKSRRRLEYSWKCASGVLRHGIVTMLFALSVFALGFALVALTRWWIATASKTPTATTMPSVNRNNTSDTTTLVDPGVVENSENVPLSSSSETSKLMRFDEFISFVVSQGWSSGKDIADRKGPQWQASVWLADFDKLSLDFRDESIQQKVLERYAAAVLFFALDGRNWDRDLGWISDVPVCEWSGVTANSNLEQIKIGIDCACATSSSAETTDCDSSTIKRVVLPSMRLKGTIPPEIRHLAHLWELDLNHNQVSGTFPSGLQTLPNLEILALHSNRFNGVLPDWLGEMNLLRTLKIADNHFKGQIPASVQNLTQLEVIYINENNFAGNEVNIFWGLQNVQLLLASNVGLVGDLTQDLWPERLPSLRVLDLSENFLEGTIPPNIVQHKTLAVIDLSNNALHGPIPNTIPDDGSCQIRYFDVSFNNLTENFPQSMQYAHDLYHIDVAGNMLSGTFPDYLDQDQLRYIDLSHNDFDAGPVPTQLGNLNQLEHLALQRTNRRGAIDGIQMDEWTKLRNLDLGDNELNGQIPQLLTAASELQRVILYRNQLTGDFAGVMKHFPHLNSLIVHQNAWTQGVKVAALCLPNLEEFIMDNCINSQEDDVVENGQLTSTSYCPCCQCCVDPADCPPATHYFGHLDPVWDTEFVRAHYRVSENDLTVAATSKLLSMGEGVTLDNNKHVDPEGNTRGLRTLHR